MTTLIIGGIILGLNIIIGFFYFLFRDKTALTRVQKIDLGEKNNLKPVRPFSHEEGEATSYDEILAGETYDANMALGKTKRQQFINNLDGKTIEDKSEFLSGLGKCK